MSVEGSPIIRPHYSTREYVERFFGRFNADVYADIESSGDAATIANRFDDALDQADNRVNARAAMLQAPIPPIGSALYSEIVSFATVYAGVVLYRGRGVPSDNNKQAGVFQKELDDAEQGLTVALETYRDTAPVQAFASAPVALQTYSNRAAFDRCGVYGWREWGWGF